MKIACFYPKNILASWYTFGGYRETLERLGHQVLDCVLPGNIVHDVEKVREGLPSIETLNQQDVILSTFHEYVQPWLAAIYGFEAWSGLKVPVIARFDESMDRGDLGLPARMPELKRWTKHSSFPAAQDAKKYGGQWLPFGADTRIFQPKLLAGHEEMTALSTTGSYQLCHRRKGHEGDCSNEPDWDALTRGEGIGYPDKKYDLAFIGTLYPDRRKYVEMLAPHVNSDVTFHCGSAIVQDLGGIRERESTELLAENYRQIKVFFCLPPASKLLVAKIFDVMACGTFLMYPRLFGQAAENLSIFKDGKHLVYYDLGYVADNGKQIKYFLEHDEERERIARAGCELVHGKYTLARMLEELLLPVRMKAMPA